MSQWLERVRARKAIDEDQPEACKLGRELQEENRLPQENKPLRPLTLNSDGTGCAVCGEADYWVAKGGQRFCLECHPAYFKDAIAIGKLTAKEETRRLSSRNM